MPVYNQHLRPTMSQLELFHVFALSNEPRGEQSLLFSAGSAIVVIERYRHVLLEARTWQAWDENIHGLAETFLIMLEDVDGEIILFSDSSMHRQRYAEGEHNVTITIPMFKPFPPNYYISVIQTAGYSPKLAFQYPSNTSSSLQNPPSRPLSWTSSLSLCQRCLIKNLRRSIL